MTPMAWRLLKAGLACSGTRYAAVHFQHAKHFVAPCRHSSAASTEGPSRHAPSRSCGLAFLSRATASSCCGAAHGLVGPAATASTDSAPSPAPAAERSDKVQRMDGSPAAAPSATATPQAAGSIPGVLAACKGSGGPTETLDQLLKLDEALESGHAESWASKEQPVEYLLAFRTLAEFEPQDIKGNPELRQAAAAARRRLMHGAAMAFMPCAPGAQVPNYLAAALLACSKVGYGWASDGDAATATAAAAAEVPLAAVVLKRLGELADAPSGLHNLEYSAFASSIGDHVVPYDQRDMHSCLWEAMAAAPPGVAAAHARLLDASAETACRVFSGAVTHPMLKALAQLHPLVREAGSLGRCLVYSVNLYDAPDLPDQELCEAVEAVGELLLNVPTARRGLMSNDGEVMSGILRMLLNEARRRLKKSVRMRVVGADAAAQRSMAARWPVRPVSKMGTQTLLRLLRGLTMISEACSAEASINPGSSSSVVGLCGSWNGDGSDSEIYYDDTDYEDDLYDGNPPQDVALQAAATAQYVASALEGRAFSSLSPDHLSDLAVWFARAGYGMSDSYRNLVSAATSSKAFTESATLAHWVQLWHALALVRHRPDDALVRCTAAAMTKQQQQQYGSATAEDCATLLLSLAELRCYDGGLVEVLLCRLVQLVAGGGGVEVRDLTNSVWAVAVMGPEALRSHCGAAGQLLRKVVAVWEQRREDVGNQEQLWQVWQMQLELEGLVDGGVGSSGGSSSSSSNSPGQLRHILPPDLLRAAEEAAPGQGPGGVLSSSRLLQRLRDEVCSVLQGMVQQGGEQQAGQGAKGQQRAGDKETHGSEATAAEGDGAVAGVAAGSVPFCTILAVTPEAAVPELRCTADAVVELGGGRRVAVEVEGPGRLLTNHPHTETGRGLRSCGGGSWSGCWGRATWWVCLPGRGRSWVGTGGGRRRGCVGGWRRLRGLRAREATRSTAVRHGSGRRGSRRARRGPRSSRGRRDQAGRRAGSIRW